MKHRIASVLLAATFAAPAVAAETVARDHHVAATSQALAIAGQTVKLYVRERALPSVMRHGAGDKVVLFVHGAGSDVSSPRDEAVATALAEVGIASVRFDLLSEFERYRHLEIQVSTMVERLTGVISWVRRQVDLRGLPIGLNGANSGIVGVLALAAEPGAEIVAIVSRGGRPDELAVSIHDVVTPSLFIVGGADDSILEANRTTAMLIDAPSELSVIPGASHHFVEPGALEMVAEITRDWFFTWMVRKHEHPDRID